MEPFYLQKQKYMMCPCWIGWNHECLQCGFQRTCMNYCRSGRRLTVELDQWLVSCQSPNCPWGQPLPLSLVTELATETIPPPPHPPQLTSPHSPSDSKSRTLERRKGWKYKQTDKTWFNYVQNHSLCKQAFKQPSNQHCRSLPPLPPLSGH